MYTEGTVPFTSIAFILQLYFMRVNCVFIFILAKMMKTTSRLTVILVTVFDINFTSLFTHNHLMINIHSKGKMIW